MNIEKAASCMAELGHVKRLSIYKLLVKAGPDGIPVGVIGRQLDIPGSTLSHHLKRLASVGLIQQMPDKQVLYCQPVYDQLNQLIQFLTEECCQQTQQKNDCCPKLKGNNDE